MMGSSSFIAIIHILFLDCVGNLWQTGEFWIVSIKEGIVKSVPSNKLKPIFFPEGGSSISYVRIVVSQNGVDAR